MSSQQKIDERVKKWQDLMQATESLKVFFYEPVECSLSPLYYIIILGTCTTLPNLSFPDSPQHSSQSVLEENERIFTEMMQALERRYIDVKEMIRAQETALVTQAERHLSRMEEEITLLKMKHNDLERLSHSEDHIHFLQVFSNISVGKYGCNWVFLWDMHEILLNSHYHKINSLFWLQSWQSLSGPSGYEDLSKVTLDPVHSFDKVKKAISELKVQVEDVSKGELNKISSAGW